MNVQLKIKNRAAITKTTNNMGIIGIMIMGIIRIYLHIFQLLARITLYIPTSLIFLNYQKIK